jgi:prepilin-type N-terminal cleavage/methylation domain-containing protein
MGRFLDRKRISFVGHRSSGFTLIEVMVSGVLLGIVLMMAVPTLELVRKERRATDWQRRALIEVANVMDRYTARSWDVITQETATEFAQDSSIQGLFPKSKLEITVRTLEAEPAAKQVVVELSRKTVASTPIAPVRLTAWVYRQGGMP